MNKINRTSINIISFGIISVSFIFFLENCRYTVYPENPTLPPFERIIVAPTEKKRVLLQIDYASYTNGKLLTTERNKIIIGEKYYNEIKDELDSTGLYTLVKEGDPFHYKVSANIRLYMNQNTGILILSGLTALIIPTEEKGSLALALQIFDSNQKELSTIRRSEEHSFIAQILLVFLMPFDWPFGKDTEQRQRLIRSAVNEFRLLTKEVNRI
ncbi:hypothetical protein [Leptospira dzoumogneensis]|uniref:Uncharacterized protein n=1 Tax=Leptospira dzoumogneensis TaxID=2484904 RepID=A0A4Z1A999_9LEPT|nr:hypothetical protein [Leptospira dzoumogneensis]TGM96061.1 hypothetical protein EHR06_17170 [Leptospira dzoumogneensis]